MNVFNFIKRAVLGSTTSGKEGALLVGTDTKTNLGNATTVEAALTNIDSRMPAAVDGTEVGYLNGVTSSIQTQLDGKAASSHTHSTSDVTGLTEAVDDRVAALLVAGTNVTLTYNDGAGTLTVDAAAADGMGELADDASPDLGGNLNVSAYSIVDTNGNELLKFGVTASAVNEITVTNAATANAPSIAATGGDTNISLLLNAKGTGLIKLGHGTHRDINAPADGSTITLDCSLSNIHMPEAITNNRTIALSNVKVGQVIALAITQDGSGGHTITWFSTIRWAGGSEPVLTTAPNKRDWLLFVCTGTNTYDGFVIGGNV